jgi:hypothetical protein
LLGGGCGFDSVYVVVVYIGANMSQLSFSLVQDPLNLYILD